MTESVSVVVSTYNRSEKLKECLESLFDQSYPKDKYEVIVVNDGSSDNTEDVLKECAKKAPCEFRWLTQENRGAAAARNRGIRSAKKDIICFIDDDCIADKCWIENLVKGFDDETVGGAGGRILAHNSRSLVERYLESKMDQEVAINLFSFVATGNAAYRRHVLEKLGGFDESFKSSEDNDLGIRVRLAGYKLKYVPEAVVYHKHETTIKDLIKKYYRYGTGLSCLAKKYLYFSLKEIFIFLVFKLGLNITSIFGIIVASNKKQKLVERILNIISISSYIAGILGGYLFLSYPKEKVIDDKLDFLKSLKDELNLQAKIKSKLKIR